MIDGVCLASRHLSPCRDYRILLHTPRKVAPERAMRRDLASWPSPWRTGRHYHRRYFAAQDLRAAEVDLEPWEDAVVVTGGDAVRVRLRSRSDESQG
ncbi:MAG: hypothetical protein ACP5QO_06040 [Clostridia bacterium]